MIADITVTLNLTYDVSKLKESPEELIKLHWNSLIEYLNEDGAFNGYNDMETLSYNHEVKINQIGNNHE